MIKIVICVLMGYLLGSLSPSALLSKLKKKNLRTEGTGNLGATNTMLVLGKKYGAFVMIFDIAKAFLSVKLAQMLFPFLAIAGLLAGGAAVAGHIFPFYMKFKGGKGLAAFGGLVLGIDPWMFLILLTVGLTAMFIVNYSFALPMSAAVLFPILYGIKVKKLPAILISVAVSILIICIHISNVHRARRGEDAKIREYVKEHLFQ